MVRDVNIKTLTSEKKKRTAPTLITTFEARLSVYPEHETTSQLMRRVLKGCVLHFWVTYVVKQYTVESLTKIYYDLSNSIIDFIFIVGAGQSEIGRR